MSNHYITLGELVKIFRPELYGRLFIVLDSLASSHGNISPETATELREFLSKSLRYFEKLSLTEKISLTPVSLGFMRQLLDVLADSQKGEEIPSTARALQTALDIELSNQVFLHLNFEELQLARGDIHHFGEDVFLNFPEARFDIEEASHCLAYHRATACVFHLMRVMEVALRVLGDTLKLPPTTNPTWDAILTKCDSELTKRLAQRSPEWQVDDVFFSGATGMLRAVKDAWRNPTMHVEKVYTEEQAEDIWNAVKGFMRHLATKLKE